MAAGQCVPRGLGTTLGGTYRHPKRSEGTLYDTRSVHEFAWSTPEFEKRGGLLLMVPSRDARQRLVNRQINV
jgi:hypothetical protein